MRGVGRYLAVSALLAALAGCSSYWFEAREPWRSEAEQQCLKSGAVKESPSVALLRPINGPGVCGADYPLKVAALGESAMLSFADDLRPPASVPGAEPAYPRPVSPAASYPPYTPSYPAPVSSSPILATPPTARAPAPERVYDDRSNGRYMPDPMSESGGVAYPVRRREISRQVYSPDEEYTPEMDAADHDPSYPNPSYPDPRVRSRERLREAPRTITPAPPPRATQVPLGSPRGPITTTAAVQPAATLACPIVSALDRWIIDSVQPAAMRWFRQPVVEIRQISAYSCRGMNGQPGAHISEHAFGNALDIAAFTLADGRKVSVETGWRGLPEEQGFLHDVQLAACEQFTTVLAPGSNRFHYNHIHVDLMRRRSARHICNPEAISGEEVAARAAQSGRAVARSEEPYDRREDPFAWRGRVRSRSSGTTGSVKVDVHKPSAYQPTDDEDALED
ncbi:MAG: extensin family protein [Xanthobacteraceae bacterium]